MAIKRKRQTLARSNLRPAKLKFAKGGQGSAPAINAALNKASAPTGPKRNLVTLDINLKAVFHFPHYDY